MAAPLGNTNAASAKIWQQAIKRALARRANSTVDAGLDQLADKLIDTALDGDSWALLEIGNRLDGKPVAATEMTASVEARSVNEIVIRGVGTNGS